jgi:hypothetical protein
VSTHIYADICRVVTPGLSHLRRHLPGSNSRVLTSTPTSPGFQFPSTQIYVDICGVLTPGYLHLRQHLQGSNSRVLTLRRHLRGSNFGFLHVHRLLRDSSSWLFNTISAGSNSSVMTEFIYRAGSQFLATHFFICGVPTFGYSRVSMLSFDSKYSILYL